MTRPRVVSNYGDGDCGAGEIHTRVREISRRVSSKFRACVCISPAPQSPSPKLETTRSLRNDWSLRQLKKDTENEIWIKYMIINK